MESVIRPQHVLQREAAWRKAYKEKRAAKRAPGGFYSSPHNLDEWGNTPLLDIAGDSLATDDELRRQISMGADVHHKNKAGENALMIAHKRGSSRKAAILVESGLSPQETDNNGRNLIMHVFATGDYRTAAKLAEEGLKIDFDDQAALDACAKTMLTGDRETAWLSNNEFHRVIDPLKQAWILEKSTKISANVPVSPKLTLKRPQT